MLFPFISSVGVAAYTLPESAPWSLALLFVAAILSVTAAAASADDISRSTMLFVLVVSVSIVIAVAGMLIPATLATAFLSALALAHRFPYAAIGILLLQSSYASSLQELLNEQMHLVHLEAASPAVLACLAMLIAQSNVTWQKLILLTTPLLIVFIAKNLVSSPWVLMVTAVAPALILAGTAVVGVLSEGQQARRLRFVMMLLVLGTMGWIITPPRTPESAFVLLPSNTEAPEAKLYENYGYVMEFGGLDFKVVETVEQIPAKSLLLLPWLTVPLNDDNDRDLIPRIKELAKTRGWTVLLIGEHTNLKGVGDRIATLVGHSALRSDLTTPRINVDYSGPLRVGDFRAWPHNSMFNRGASVAIFSPLDRILLKGDGWWAEPDIGEWLWVGDYLWQPTDRNGRITLGASIDEGSARWVVIGDTSPFVSRQLVADPRAAKQIIQMTTLWPLLFRDMWITLLCVLCVVGKYRYVAKYLSAVILGPLLLIMITQDNVDAPWRSIWRQESGFDESNFNTTISSNPELALSGWRLIRVKDDLTGEFRLPGGRSVIFGLVENQVTIAEVSLHRCHRIGSLKTEEGPYLMDAQACQATGDVEILLGDGDGAAVVRVAKDNNEAIIILDRKYLSQKAPPENSTWLMHILKSSVKTK